MTADAAMSGQTHSVASQGGRGRSSQESLHRQPSLAGAQGAEQGGGGEGNSGHEDLDAYRHSRRMSRNSSAHRRSISTSRANDDVAQTDRGGATQREKADAPACLVTFTEKVQACSQSVQAWSDQQEEKARRKKEARRNAEVTIEEDGTVKEPKADPWLQRKGIIFLVFIILSWVYIVFTWRICAAGIQRQPRALVGREEGIGLLVGFNVLWLMTVWTYIKVITTGPGYVRDHVAITESPTAPVEETFAPGPVGPAGNGEYPSMDQTVTRSNNSPNSSSPQGQSEDGVDPGIAAAIGPMGAGQLAKADEEKAVMAEEGKTTAMWTMHPQQQKPETTANGIPEPIRIPQQTMPLYANNLYCYRCKRIKPPRAHHCRHCATCVLKMDHHCPWVGGCVGARNHKFFYHFLQWVSILEVYVLVINAVLFNRGIQRRTEGGPSWPIDGYMISLFPIVAMFALFTITLLITHSYLFVLNLTTIEHMAYDRMKTREEILLSRYLDARNDSGEKLTFGQKLKEKKRIKAKWSMQWGNLKTEANLWWLDDEQKARERKRAQGWNDSVGPNWKAALGDAWYHSLLPIGRAKSDGLAYDTNWRFGRGGQWRMRDDWRKEE